ncbi:hypothetical protein SBADM41S_10540 [Streptomyces badius]
MGRRAWSYVADVAHDSGHERTDLVFDGLDTAARITFDGREIGTTRNTHRSYRFDVTGVAGRQGGLLRTARLRRHPGTGRRRRR